MQLPEPSVSSDRLTTAATGTADLYKVCDSDELYDRTSTINTHASRTPSMPRHGVGSLSRSGQHLDVANNSNTYMSRRYNYRSRSDLGTLGRRTGSSTILDGSRPGPTTPTAPSWRRDALESLQRELDTISRSPVSPPGQSSRAPAQSYSADTGYANDTWKSSRHGQFEYGASLNS